MWKTQGQKWHVVEGWKGFIKAAEEESSLMQATGWGSQAWVDRSGSLEILEILATENKYK